MEILFEYLVLVEIMLKTLLLIIFVQEHWMVFGIKV